MYRFRPRGAIVAMVVALLTCSGGPAYAQQAPGNVILARVAGDALLVWDASPDVKTIAVNKLSDDAANALLRHDGLKAIAQSLSEINTKAKTVTVRIVYDRSGAVSPAYGSPTFAGVERYASLGMSWRDAITNRGNWKSLAANSPLPDWIQFKVTGSLPPR